MKKIKTLEISLVAFGMVLNLIGTFTAFTLKLPILLDSIGTILISILLGPILGIITGLGGSILSGITFDIYSLYFAPVQIVVALFTYLIFKGDFFKGKKKYIGVLALSILTSIAGSIIAAFVFGGITSSGSSYIVAILSNLGINKVVSVFVVQFFTDFIDKFIGVSIAVLAISEIPKTIKERLVNN
ncbi:MAG: hypothetical protein ACTHW2_11095 [Tissierella sp.]|uniref:hypothetical protein n=1 Tax=Tissierella sp. TaxID=41274 RepID=UPI003F9CBF11